LGDDQAPGGEGEEIKRVEKIWVGFGGKTMHNSNTKNTNRKKKEWPPNKGIGREGVPQTPSPYRPAGGQAKI